jgi:hypothetical protein
MKGFKKFISLILIVTLSILNINISFANTAFEQAQESTKNAPKVFDGKATLGGLKADITQKSTSNPSQIKQEPPQEEKPSFLTKVGWDIQNNKESYITLALASGFLGFLLGGPIGAIIGIGAMFAFTISQRAWYIDAYATPPGK